MKQNDVLSYFVTQMYFFIHGHDYVWLKPFWLRHAVPLAMEHRLLLNGKYKNRTFTHAEADRRYCIWILGSTWLPLSLRLFKHYLKQRHGGIFRIGKHKDCFFDEVLQSDPSYTSWVMGLQDASGNFREYQFYIESRHEVVFHTDGRSRSRTIAQCRFPRCSCMSVFFWFGHIVHNMFVC